MIDSFQHNGRTVTIQIDENPDSPRERDNLATMVCFHNRYNLGDTAHDYKPSDFAGWDNLRQRIIWDHCPVVILPLYMMDHSGLSISTDPDKFRVWDSAGWDWGQIGFVFVSRKDAQREYKANRISPELRKQSGQALLGEVETYDQYLRGEVYGYLVKDDSGEVVDSCWGFYGLDYVREEAKRVAEQVAV